MFEGKGKRVERKREIRESVRVRMTEGKKKKKKRRVSLSW